MQSNKAYARSGHEVTNLRKSKFGGWVGEVDGTPFAWCFDFTYPRCYRYVYLSERRIRGYKLDIVKLPVGFDEVPNYSTPEEMAPIISKLTNNCI